MESKRASAKKQIDFAVRYQPEAGTPDAALLEYIRDSRVVPSREMVFQALRAFWLPFAYKANGELTTSEEMQLAKEAIYALDKHADYICSYFGLERPDFLNARQSPVNGKNPRFAARHETLSEKKPTSAPAYLEEEDYDPDSSFPDE